MNRLFREIDPIGNETHFEYDVGGNRVAKVDGMGRRTEYQYDANRRLVRIDYPDGTEASFAYDSLGNRIHEVTEYRWDRRGLLSALVDPQGGLTHFSYDKAGRRTRLTHANGVRTDYEYDPAGRLLSLMTRTSAGEVIDGYVYTHDRNGNRLSKTYSDGGLERYEYDALQRLVEAVYPGGRTQRWEYDGVGNRLRQLDSPGLNQERDRAGSADGSVHFTASNGHLGYDRVWDVSEYDTRTDSLSGSWRCNDTASWYNEASGSTRSTKACFPERVYLVATAKGLDIIDARTDRMWMRFEIGYENALSKVVATGNGDPYHSMYYDAQVTAVDAIDGVVYAAISSGPERRGYGGRVVAIDFINDRIELWGSGNNAGVYSGGIADRNSGAGHSVEVVNQFTPGTQWVFDLDVERVNGEVVLAAGAGDHVSVYRKDRPGSIDLLDLSYGTDHVYQCLSVELTEGGVLYAAGVDRYGESTYVTPPDEPSGPGFLARWSLIRALCLQPRRCPRRPTL